MSEQVPESSEMLLQYLEQASGRKLRTRDDVRQFLDEVSSKDPQTSRATTLWRTLKQGMWLALMVIAYLQFYLLDVMNQINSIPEIRVNLPMTKLYGKSSPRI
jgi:hypothetical protein